MRAILDLRTWVVLAGAAITVAGPMIAGFRAHRALLRLAPRLATVLPPDAGAVLGLLAGAWMVARWL